MHLAASLPLLLWTLAVSSPGGAGTHAPSAGPTARAAPPAGRAAHAANPPVGAPAARQAADIEGRLILKPLPPRRIASRYAGGGPGAGAQLQELPAVVYLRGVPGSVPPERKRMAQRDTTFVPALLVVTLGSTVDFPNQDPFFHNVFSYSKAKRFDLGRYPNPEAKPVTFDRPGVVNVFCEIHRSMRGVILVVDNPYYAQVGADGAFRIQGVPPGTYELVAWHADRGEQQQRVQVPASGTLRVNLAL